MAILKFRIYWEDDDSVYRDVVIRHSQNFADFHNAILKSYEFDNKHKATFYRSNDKWLRGREISLEKYADKQYKAEPLLMAETLIASEIKNPNERFIYVYDFNKFWTFMVELINVDKEENKKLTYPICVRSEGIAPSQYGTKGLIDSRLAEVEEKYDLNSEALSEGFSEEGEDGESEDSTEEEATTDEGNDGF
jgi:Plasmid pRiA4b ORF-3-like protein